LKLLKGNRTQPVTGARWFSKGEFLFVFDVYSLLSGIKQGVFSSLRCRATYQHPIRFGGTGGCQGASEGLLSGVIQGDLLTSIWTGFVGECGGSTVRANVCSRQDGRGGCLRKQRSLLLVSVKDVRRRSMLVKRFRTTRLGTRTKESNMYASLRVRNSRAKRKRKRIRGLVGTFLHNWPVLRREDRVRAFMMGPERW